MKVSQLTNVKKQKRDGKNMSCKFEVMRTLACQGIFGSSTTTIVCFF